MSSCSGDFSGAAVVAVVVNVGGVAGSSCDEQPVTTAIHARTAMEKKSFMSSDVVVIVQVRFDGAVGVQYVLSLAFTIQLKVSQLMGVVATVKKDCWNVFAPVHLNISHVIVNGE